MSFRPATVAKRIYIIWRHVVSFLCRPVIHLGYYPLILSSNQVFEMDLNIEQPQKYRSWFSNDLKWLSLMENHQDISTCNGYQVYCLEIFWWPPFYRISGLAPFGWVGWVILSSWKKTLSVLTALCEGIRWSPLNSPHRWPLIHRILIFHNTPEQSS